MAGVQGMDGQKVGNERTPRPGSRINLECSDLDRDGKGIARWNGWVVVVDDFFAWRKG
jgi:23S rRNA (uracil1939-C5)-methyltransferase